MTEKKPPVIVSTIGYGGEGCSLWQRLAGLSMLLLVVFLWLFGGLSPFLVVLLFWHGGPLCTAVAGLLIFLTAWPYIAKPKPWPAFRRAISTLGQYYHLEARIHLENDMLVKRPDGRGHMRVTRPTIACFHPHGITCQGYILNGGFRPEVEPMPGLLAEALYYAPLFHWFITSWTNATKPASKWSMLRLMRKGESFGLIPGGFEEAAIFECGKERVFIKNRKGFIKYALQYGYRLMPCYTFGEVDTYFNVPFGGFEWRARLAAYHVPVVLPIGAWWCPLLPRRARLNTVWGPHLELPQIAEPTAEQVDKHHAEYLAALVALFERHKKRFASDPNAELDVW